MNSYIKFEKLLHLVGFIIRIYHDARSSERQISLNELHKFLCSAKELLMVRRK